MILITGCARSGTSMVAGVLHASGLDFGRPLYMKRHSYQPRGFYEHKGVRELVVKPLLRQLGADPRGQNPLPARHIIALDGKAAKFAKRVRRELGKAQAYKDAKILLIWPFFHGAFPNARWVLVRRDAKAIARSCLRTKFMRRRTYYQSWLDWVEEHEERMADLKAAGADVFEIWPDPSEPESFRGLLEFCGLEFDADKVRGALVPEAWHFGGRP